MTPLPSRPEDIAFQELVAHYWHDWRRYLRASLAIVRARQEGLEDAGPLFERAGSPAQQPEQELAALPPERRALFERHYAERREEILCELEAAERAASNGASAPALDPDEVSRVTLERLSEEADGLGDAGGWGIVPLPDAVYRVRVADLLAQPTPEQYRLRGRAPADERRRALVGSLALALGLLIALGWWFLRPGGPPRAAAAPAPPTANGAPLDVWQLRRVSLSGAGMPDIELPISPAGEGAWPQLPAGEPRAYWRPATAWPIELCAPGEALARSDRALIAAESGAPDRVYELRDDPAGPRDIVLSPCDGAGPPRYGALVGTLAPEWLDLGQETPLPGGGSLSLLSVAIAGPAEDAAIPAGQALVTVQFRVAWPAAEGAAIDWPRYAATLRLADGTAMLPLATPEPSAREGALTYLIPLPAAPGEALWTIAPPGERVSGWRVALPAPPDRAEVLRRALHVADATLDLDGERAPLLRLTLENRGDRELQLGASDIGLTQAGARVALPELAELHEPLAPGERRVVAIELPAGRGAPLLLSVGAARYQIAPAQPEEGGGAEQ